MGRRYDGHGIGWFGGIVEKFVYIFKWWFYNSIFLAIFLSDVDDVRPILQYYSQFDDPAAEFRRRASMIEEQKKVRNSLNFWFTAGDFITFSVAGEVTFQTVNILSIISVQWPF